MCNSAQWWVAFKGGELPPSRLWVLLLVLGTHYAFVAFNHAMFVFQAYKPPFACEEENPDGSVTRTMGCQANCSGAYVFLEADQDATIVTEWSLVCSRAALRPLTATLYFLGVAVGALVCGVLADRWGRRTVMTACLLGQAALGAALSFAPSLEAFAAVRTVHGVFVQGLQGSTFTLLLELFPGRLRTAVGVALEIYWALGLALLAVLSYALPHWRDLQLAVSVPTLATALILPWVPESRLWLASRDQSPPFRRGLPGHGSYREKGEDGALVQSQPNNSPEPPPSSPSSSPVSGEAPALPAERSEAPVTAKDLFLDRSLRLYTLCMFDVWFSVPLSYYVTTFNMPALQGDRHVNFVVGAALEVLAYCCAFVALSRLGRRLPLASFLATSAVCCFAVAAILLSVDAVDKGGVAVLVLVLGCKATLVSAFCTMFLYTGELFPTAVRAAALGFCGFVGRVGNLLSPQVVHLGDGGREWMPFVFIGALLMTTSLSSLLLPETLGRELPATLEDARRLRHRLRHRLGRRRDGADGGDGAEEQPLNNAIVRNSKLTIEDYKVPDWKSDVPQLEPDKVQSAKKRGSMSALELGQGLLAELNRTPGAERAERTRSLYLETNLDDPLVGRESQHYKSTVSSAV